MNFHDFTTFISIVPESLRINPQHLETNNILYAFFVQNCQHLFMYTKLQCTKLIPMCLLLNSRSHYFAKKKHDCFTILFLYDIVVFNDKVYKADLLANCEVVTFPLVSWARQVWWLIVSIPDLCPLSYFYLHHITVLWAT